MWRLHVRRIRLHVVPVQGSGVSPPQQGGGVDGPRGGATPDRRGCSASGPPLPWTPHASNRRRLRGEPGNALRLVQDPTPSKGDARTSHPETRTDSSAILLLGLPRHLRGADDEGRRGGVS